MRLKNFFFPEPRARCLPGVCKAPIIHSPPPLFHGTQHNSLYEDEAVAAQRNFCLSASCMLTLCYGDRPCSVCEPSWFTCPLGAALECLQSQTVSPPRHSPRIGNLQGWYGTPGLLLHFCLHKLPY